MTYSAAAYYGNGLGNLSRIEVVAFLFSVQGSVCLICGKYLRKQVATIDHVIPRSRGGAHHILNWALAHRLCNSRKGANWPTADELARHRKIVRKLRRALFWMRIVAPIVRLRRLLRLGVQQ